MTSVSADQNDDELDALFAELAVAEAHEHAARLESQIWQHWLTAPTEPSQMLIEQVEMAMRSGDMLRALASADKLVELVPGYAEGWNKRATIRYLVGDYEGSVDDIDRTLALEPRHFGALSGLGLILLKQSDRAAALTAFEKVLALSPASRHAQANVARLRGELGTEI